MAKKDQPLWKDPARPSPKMFRELIRASQKQATPPKLERRYYENPDKKKEARYNKHDLYSDYVRCQMRYLVETVSRCEGVDEAFAKMGKKKEKQKALLDRFRKRNVSPVPLRKNFSAMLLPTPSALLLQLSDPEGEPVRIPYVRIK